jgi:2-oxoglutarate ferredoxin oxidoreductase subunit alpha
MGQLTALLRSTYLVDAQAVTKVQGLPFKSREIEAAIDEMLVSLGNSAKGNAS